MEENAIKELINSVRWVYAKTYPYAPHEYTVFEWAPDKISIFRQFASHISEHGGWEPFFNTKTWYYRFEDMKYWIMSNPSECTLINRTFIDNSIDEQITKFVSSPNFVFQNGMSLVDIVNLIEQNKISKYPPAKPGALPMNRSKRS